MLTLTANLSRAPFRWTQILAAATALLMLGASAEALTRGEKQIQKKLSPAGTKLSQASDDQIYDATLLAIQSPTNPDTLTSEIVKAAMKYIPQRGTDVVQAGLTKVKTSQISASLRVSEGKTIVSSVMRAALQGVENELIKPANPADRAAAITRAAVEVVKDLPTNDTLFSAAIRGAVGVGAEIGKGSKNGAAGAVTGAIAEAAGVSNDNLSPSSSAGDALVTVIIQAAAKKAPQRALEIAEASGYAFAAAYRGTTTDSSEITLDVFLANNLQDIRDAIISVLPTNKAKKLAVQINDRVQAGIALAYGGIPTNGAKGVSFFAYNNGVLPDISNIAGL